jgi:hypothetical protein
MLFRRFPKLMNQLMKALCIALIALSHVLPAVAAVPVPVTIENFPRAETDRYFSDYVAKGSFGRFVHSRTMADVDHQSVVRMNRDTIYSSGVFDLAAAPLTVTLPEAGNRFMSLLVVSHDHHATDVIYGAGAHRFTQEKVGTRYVFMIIRTFANPQDPADMAAAHALQDRVRIEQASPGKWEAPAWDDAARTKIRKALEDLDRVKGATSGDMFGRRGEVDPVLHLLGTAVGWGGNPRYAAMYSSVYPSQNDGKTAYRVTLKDVPVDGFWSVSVYNEAGYFEKNERNAYSLNNLTAKPNVDGSFAIQFGGDPGNTPNYLPITNGWNYTLRLYRPREEILDGSWKVPEAQPVK